jgi:hypothetical protein
MAKCVKIQAYGMQIKNNTSSIGRLKTFHPIKYLELNPQTPIFVNIISQITKGRATIMIPKITDFQCLIKYRSLLKLYTRGINIEPKFNARYKYIIS